MGRLIHTSQKHLRIRLHPQEAEGEKIGYRQENGGVRTVDEEVAA